MTAFKAVENKNPTKEPIAAFSALETSLGAPVSSPKKAPKKGPTRCPQGRRTSQFPNRYRPPNPLFSAAKLFGAQCGKCVIQQGSEQCDCKCHP